MEESDVLRNIGARLILDLSQWSESNSCKKNFCQLPGALALARFVTRGCQVNTRDWIVR